MYIKACEDTNIHTDNMFSLLILIMLLHYRFITSQSEQGQCRTASIILLFDWLEFMQRLFGESLRCVTPKTIVKSPIPEGNLDVLL